MTEVISLILGFRGQSGQVRSAERSEPCESIFVITTNHPTEGSPTLLSVQGRVQGRVHTELRATE